MSDSPAEDRSMSTDGASRARPSQSGASGARLSAKSARGKAADRQAEYMRGWRERNRDHVREEKAAWLDANRDHVREYNRVYMRAQAEKKKREAERRERRREYAREWYVRNRERYLQQQKESRAQRKAADPDGFRRMANARTQRWRDRHRDAVNDYGRERRRDNPHARTEYSRRYYEENRDQILERAKQRYERNREQIRARANARNARERRRQELGLPPRRLHRVVSAERAANAVAADEFFARSYSKAEIRAMSRGPATPPELYAEWERDCARARAEHRRAADSEEAERRRNALERTVAEPHRSRQAVELARAAEDARMDAIARDINNRLRRGPRPDTPGRAPHQPSAGITGSQLHL